VSSQLAVTITNYAPYVQGQAGLLAIEIPEGKRGPDLLLGHFRFVVYETEAEKGQILAGVDGASFSPWAEGWDQTPSRRESNRIFISIMPPPESLPAYPYFIVVAWPRSLANQLREGPDTFNRGCYTVEAYATYAEAIDYVAWFNGQFQNIGFKIKVQSPEDISTPGKA
jgi:hypothetical protein